ncbi:hypothetical protein U7230_08310 [Carboxydochorda subterranea]|uniref:Uncharacterized protein n=1 Tax=Carboxydichorda subterranea TaxID=3109565 RepID=A0ABZ1BU08_9FIRM|nr:hypothetical protein [Limnochorda sp. L945t]WRP16110.1 hypothetical protein U7230_08310 [Limnochorda sp. L945t]
MSLTREQQDEIQRIVTQQINDVLKRRLLRAPVQPVTPQPLVPPGGGARREAQQGGILGPAAPGSAPASTNPGVNWWAAPQGAGQPSAQQHGSGDPSQPQSAGPEQQAAPGPAQPGQTGAQGHAVGSAAAAFDNASAGAVAAAVAQALVEAQTTLTMQLKATLVRLKDVVTEAQELSRRMERLLGEAPASDEPSG